MRFFRRDVYASAEALQAAVEHHLRRMSEFPMWTVGTTEDADLRAGELDEPAFWSQWEAADAEIAATVKHNLVKRGMRLDPRDRPGRALYVY